MINIQILIMFLTKNLSNSAQDYILYFDNFFINSSLIKILRKLDIKIMKIIQIKALELSLIIR